MSSAANSAVATVPLERGIEILERRLIDLRADIDAILTQLASSKTAIPVTEPTDTPEADASVAIAEHEPAPAATGYFGDEMDQFSGATQLAAIEPDRTSVVETSPETALVKELPIASIEADPAGRPNGLEMVLDTTATPVAETAAPQAQLQAEPTGQAAATALAPSASLEPAAAIVPESASDSVAASSIANPDVAAETTVISLQSRQRKQKAGFSAGASAPSRTGRRLATKIAASIVALLAAATMLAVADKDALGSAQTLPWMSPLPSSGLGQAANQASPTSDSSLRPAPVTVAPADDTLLSRYREVWPGSW
jgi:hypothetical protein